jgi:hypothetical protein
MMSGMVQRLAHIGTPWDWRDRRTVVALAVIGVTLCVGSIVSALASTEQMPGTRLVGAVVWGVVTFLLFANPAVRSLRRWDEAHRRR